MEHQRHQLSKSVARSKRVTSKAAKPTTPRTPRSKPQALDGPGDVHLRRIAALVPVGVEIVEHARPWPKAFDLIETFHALTVEAIEAFEAAASASNRFRVIDDEIERRDRTLRGGSRRD